MYTYVCHIRRKDGEYDTGLDFYQGAMPTVGEIVQIVIYGEALKARVGVVSNPQRELHGVLIVHVYVEEV
jgi:hypothetical protein